MRRAGVVFHDIVLSSRFRHEVRGRESPFFDAWFGEGGVFSLHALDTTFPRDAPVKADGPASAGVGS